MEKSLRARALDALARREHSRLELARKLSVYAENEATLVLLLDDLQNRGWLSDARYAEQRAHARQSRYGSQKIAYELRAQGIDETLVATTLEGLKATEFERARLIWEKKFGVPASDARERGQQFRFLQARGFSQDVIYRLIHAQNEP